MSDQDTEFEREPLFVKDSELIARLNVPPKTARTVLAVLDKDPRSGFPPKQKLWGDRRYWPAVSDYFQNVYGLKIAPSPQRRER